MMHWLCNVNQIKTISLAKFSKINISNYILIAIFLLSLFLIWLLLESRCTLRNLYAHNKCSLCPYISWQYRNIHMHICCAPAQIGTTSQTLPLSEKIQHNHRMEISIRSPSRICPPRVLNPAMPYDDEVPVVCQSHMEIRYRYLFDYVHVCCIWCLCPQSSLSLVNSNADPKCNKRELGFRVCAVLCRLRYAVQHNAKSRHQRRGSCSLRVVHKSITVHFEQESGRRECVYWNYYTIPKGAPAIDRRNH